MFASGMPSRVFFEPVSHLHVPVLPDRLLNREVPTVANNLNRCSDPRQKRLAPSQSSDSALSLEPWARSIG